VSFFNHHIASICDSFVHPTHLQGTPLDIWPPLPLIICGIFNDNSPRVDNIIAALEHNDRVCQIGFDYSTYSSSPLGYITDSSAMQKPFPELTHLHISRGWTANISPFVLEWGRTTAAITCPGLRSISGITASTFLCHPPRQTLSSRYSSFRVYFTRGDVHLPLHVDQPRNTST